MTIRKLITVLGTGLALTACGSDAPTDGRQAAGPDGTAATSVAPTGNVIEVKMVTDGAGNYFEPAQVNASPGDVVRFVLVSGVHNVSFPAAENGNASGLPQASSFLQLPGQTHDVPVEMGPGSYKFQCDPHVPLGMVGTLTVQ